jgi:GT2 family glycosyltransferase
MKEAPETNDYLFRFDGPTESRVFGDAYNLSGWLLHPDGKLVTGIRAVLKRPLRRRRIFAARRKRSRPDVAAAFPHLSEAKASGFLLELRLGFGRNRLTLQVRDEDRVWRTFHTLSISAYPLSVLRKIGFANVRDFLVATLQQRYAAKSNPFEGSAPVIRVPLSNGSRSLVAPKRVDLLATTKSNLFILEIAELLAAGFRELGYDSRLLLDQLPQKDRAPDALQIVVTPHEYYNLFLTENVSRDEADELTKNVVLYCTEQPETGWFHSNLPWASKALAVADINPFGASAYQARGIESYHLPLGYHELLAAPQLSPYLQRKCDITFLGSMTARREKFFAQHAPFFANHRCHIRFVPLDFAKTRLTRSYLSPERRNDLLNDSRLFLNVHYSGQKYFEWHRALIGLANGCCFITERAEGYGDLVPGKHFIMAEREELIACCEYYLAHPKEAEAIAQEGLHFVKTELRQAKACQVLLEQLASHTGTFFALNGADAASGPLPPELKRNLHARRMQQLKRAIAADLAGLTRRGKPELSADTERDDVSIRRTSTIEKRKVYQEKLTEQQLGRSAGSAPWDCYDNDVYRGQNPSLSIIITLFNYANYIGECFRSIEQAAAQLSDTIEIVVINDASNDNSLAQALECQTKTRLATRIVDKRLNTGLADARNVGLEIARAPYVFMMDADNLIFPRALGELLATIRDGDYAAAFSLLCRFRGTQSNRVGLLSYYDWDLQVLVQRPYIDAMAMFRRDALLTAGGYDTGLSQIGWFGWEDYDMWLRFAQKGYNVAFVPNILCLYRHHETSMINLTNLFEVELVEHFIARFGGLATRFEPREMLFGVARESIPSLSSR